MHGIIRTVDFNESENQSLLHFECIHIEQGMKNEVLRYVYNILPEREKEVLEAISQTDDDIDEADRNIIQVATENQEEKESIEAAEKDSLKIGKQEDPQFANLSPDELVAATSIPEANI